MSKSHTSQLFPRLLTLVAGIVGIFGIGGLSGANAAEGRRPIYEVPVTITESGSYYLTRDIEHVGGGVSIEIQANDVTIDFAGHTLTKQNSGNYTVASDGDFTNLTIKNGRIRQGNICIRLRNSVGDAFSVRIEDMVLEGCLNEGIYVQGQSLVGSSQAFIVDNQIHDTGNDGISLRYIWGGLVEGNVIQDIGDGAGDHGLYLHSCRGMSIRNNNVSHAFGDGLRVWYSWYIAIDWNVVTYNNGYGLDIYQGDQIVYSNNRAYGNGSGGFDIPGAEGHVNAGGNYP